MGLIYAWIGIAGVGFLTSIGVLTDSLRLRAYLARARPELSKPFRIEIVRDATLFAVHCLNLSVGLITLFNVSTHQYLFLTRPLAIIGLLLVAILLTATSIFNYYIRHKFL